MPADEAHLSDDAHDPSASVGRRRALGLGLTAAVAGLATAVGADPASAASGDPLILGAVNDSTGPTVLNAHTDAGGLRVVADLNGTTRSSVNLAGYNEGIFATGPYAITAIGNDLGLQASGQYTGVSAVSGGIGVSATGSPGVLAQGGAGFGVHSFGTTGVRAEGTTAGVVASGPTAVVAQGAITGVAGSGQIGGAFLGSSANLLLYPLSAAPVGTHQTGEIFVTSSVGILVCVAAGTPGTWVRLGFNPTAPTRVCDTRTGSGLPFAGQPIGPGQELVLPVVAVAPLPPTGVSAVVMNVTMATCTADGWLTVYPNGQPRPNASNLNFTAGQSPKANQVTCGVGVGPGGALPAVRIYNSAGTTDVVVDVNGFYS